MNVHDPSQWQNPFLTVRVKTLDLRIILPNDEISSFGDGTMLRPKGARRQELQLRYADLGKADCSDSAWRMALRPGDRGSGVARGRNRRTGPLSAARWRRSFAS